MIPYKEEVISDAPAVVFEPDPDEDDIVAMDVGWPEPPGVIPETPGDAEGPPVTGPIAGGVLPGICETGRAVVTALGPVGTVGTMRVV
jgi:hypothetical protein